MKYSRGLTPLLGSTMLSLFILLGASGCGAFVDQNDPDFTELVEEADNPATLDAQTFEDVAPDFDLEGTVETPDEDTDELAEDVPAEELPVIDQAPVSNREVAPLPMTDLFETELLSAEGETWGELSDFSINVEQNRVEYAIVTFGGGLLNLTDETIALPLDILVLNPENQLVIDVDREVVETAPGFDSNNLSGAFRIQQSWSDEADAFWSSVPGHVNLGGPGEGEAPTETFVSASNLFGYQLVDDTEQVLGQVDDFIFDFNTGAVSYAVISSDAGLLDVDLDETSFLVPFSALVFQPATDEVQLAISPETIQSSPHFTPDTPPDFAQPGWDREANTYWSRQGFELSPLQSDEESTFTGDLSDENELYDDSGISAEEVRSQETVTTSQELETPN